MNLSVKQTHRNREQTCSCQRGVGWEVGMSRRELLHAGWMGAKVLLGIAQDAIQYAVINHNGKEHEKEHTHTHTDIESIC